MSMGAVTDAEAISYYVFGWLASPSYGRAVTLLLHPAPDMSAPSCDALSPDDDIGNSLLLPAAILIVLSVTTTGLRLWARREALGYDDWTILVAALLTVVLNVLSIVGVGHGKGRHACFLPDYAIAEIGKYSWINQIVLFWALFFIKTSVCLLVLRVKSNKVLRYASGIAVTLMATSTIVACAALLAECRPVSAYWNRSSGQCRAPTFRIYSIWVQASVSVLTDLICSLLPVPILWTLQLSSKKKVAVGALMALGAIAFVFAILRAASLSLKSSDTTYDYTLTGTWMTLETNIGLIASNIGPMHTLLTWWRRPKSSYASRPRSQDFHSGARPSRTATRRALEDDDSDHSLFHGHGYGITKTEETIISRSVRSTSDDIPLGRLQTTDT